MKRIQIENRTELWNEIPLDTPYVLFVDPSNKCNLKCEFCMNSKIKDKTLMKWDLYTEIIDETWMFDSPVKTLRLYGFGEPLMHKFFPEMVAYGRKGNIEKIDTTTNGILLDRTMSGEIISAGIDRINISINEMTSEIIDNIAYLHSISEDTIIFIKAIEGTIDKKSFYDIFLGISDGCDIEHLMKCWYDVPMDIEQKVGIYGQPLQNVQICPYVFYQMMIHSDGICSLCFLDWDKRVAIGDCRKDSLTKLWKRYKSYQIDMLRGMKQTMCAGCNQLKAGWPVNLDSYKNQLMEKLC